MDKTPSPRNAPPADGSLTRAALYGGFWSLLNNFGTKVLGGLKTFILAKLLAPLDFGLMGLALAVASTINLFSNPGAYTALIQKKDLEAEDMNAAWWLHAVRGLALSLLFLPLASLLARFFNEPRLVIVLRLVALGFLFDGLQSIGLVRLNRTLDFRRLAMVHQVSNLVGFAVAVTLAWYLRSVWALVFAHLGQGAAMLITSYLIAPFRPSPRVSLERLKFFLRFGRAIFFAVAAYFLLIRGNEFILGKVVGVARYGYYALAVSLVGMLSGPIDQLLTTVAFPALSQIHQDSERLESAYLRLLRTAMLVSVPLLIGLAIFGEGLVALFLGEKWMPIVGPLRWLCLAEWLQLLTLTWQALHYSMGMPQLQAKFRSLQFLFYAAGVFPMIFKFGISGAAAWLFVVGLFSFFLHLFGTGSQLPGVPRRALRLFARYWPLYALQGLLGVAAHKFARSLPQFIVLLVSYGVAAALFIGWKEKNLFMELLQTVMRRPAAPAENARKN
ncbi:MAG TPA: lipopolysaccharide biosynthesis protein [Acidobacteriota bacterium]